MKARSIDLKKVAVNYVLVRLVVTVFLTWVSVVYPGNCLYAKTNSGKSSKSTQAGSKNEKSTPQTPSSNAAPSIKDLIGDDSSLEILPQNISSQDSLLASTMSVSSVGASISEMPQYLINQFQLDPQSGSGVVQFPITMPPGRRGINPNITLTYSPRSGNSIFGMGWNIEFGRIERSFKKGTPFYDDRDTFISVANGSSMELVEVAQGEYQARVEGGFVLYKFDGMRWRAKDKLGNTYYYGLSNILDDDSIVESDGKVFSWLLSEVKDVFGNYYFIRHFNDGRFEAYFTGEPGTDRDSFGSSSQNFQVKVISVMEDSPRNDTFVNFKPKFEIRKNKRVKKINVYAGGELFKSFEFSYDYSSRTGRSMLSTITECGDDGITCLPAIEFDYTDESMPTYNVASIVNDPTQGNHLWNARFDGGYDRGDSNYGAIPPPYFDVAWGPIYTQSSGSWTRGEWSTGAQGELSFTSEKDSANWFWTYLYVDDAVTLPVSDSCTGGEIGVYINGNYSQNYFNQSWPLRAGYNLIEITGYSQNGGVGFSINTALANQVALMNSSQVIKPQYAADFNGDAMTDLATFIDETGTVQVSLSNGAAFLPKEVWSTGFGQNRSLYLGDFEGDGMTDIAFMQDSSGFTERMHSMGNEFVYGGVMMQEFAPGEQHSVGDFNGDGITEFWSFANDGGNIRARFTVADRSANMTPVSGVWPVVGEKDAFAFAADFNGDGLTDIGSFHKDSGRWQLRQNDGEYGFELITSLDNFGAGKNAIISDFDNDGLSDIGYYDYTTGKIIYRKVTTTNVSAEQYSVFSFQLHDSTAHVQSSDFNGDGLTDFAVFNQGGNIEIAYSFGDIPDLVAGIDNGIGGRTEIGYTISTRQDNIFMPFAIPVVNSVKLSNAQGQSYTSRYLYSGGYFDNEWREFFGFASARAIDAENNYALTEFYNDVYSLRGRVKKQAQYSADGRLFAETRNTWDIEKINASVSPNVEWPYLKRSDSFVYNGDERVRRSAKEYYYEEDPQWGNPTKVVSLGEVDSETGDDIGSDTRMVETSYINSPEWDVHIIGLPHHLASKDDELNPLKQEWLYYDGHEDAAPPVQGLLTKRILWNNLGESPELQYQYDSYGNLTGSIDAEGGVSSFTYDSQFHSFVVSAQNALGHTSTTRYYGIDGMPLDNDAGLHGLWGQVHSQTDPNNQNGLRSYDAVGRLIKEFGPLDSIDYPSQETEYDLDHEYMKIIQKKRIAFNLPETIATVNYYDGLGRLIQSKKSSGKSGEYIVASQTEYDSRGLPVKKYLPRFTQRPLDEMDDIDIDQPHTEMFYDAMGRQVRMNNPDGTFSNIFYDYWSVLEADVNGHMRNSSILFDDWSVLTVDANGHMQGSLLDAYGQLVEKYEYTGADGRSRYYPEENYQLYATTYYEYDSLGNLVKTKDALGNIVQMQYDSLSRKISMNDPDMGDWEYAYDLNGNLVWQKDALGQEINFKYDAINRLTRKYDNQDLDVNYEYDDASFENSIGRLTRVTYGDPLEDFGETRFFYDVLGREVASEKIIDGIAYAIEKKYNALGQVVEIKYPNQEKAYYEYDSAGTLRQVSGNFAVTPDSVQAVPPAPQEVVATGGQGVIDVSWGTAENATGYLVKWGDVSGNYSNFFDADDSSSYQIPGLDPATTYYIAVVAYNQKGNSQPSVEVSATTLSEETLEIELDASSHVQADDVTQISFNHTVAEGVNRALIVSVSMRNFPSPDPIGTSVSFGGQALTLIRRESIDNVANHYATELWYLLNPSVGSKDVVVSFNTNCDGVVAGAVSLFNVRQTAPEAVAGGFGDDYSSNVNLTTLSNGAWVIDSLVEASYSTTVTVNPSQTQLYKLINTSDLVGGSSFQSHESAGAVTMNWDFAFKRHWAQVAAAFAPAQETALHFNFKKVFAVANDNIKNVFSGIFELAQEWFGVKEVYADTVPQQFDFNEFDVNDPTSTVERSASCIDFIDLETRSTDTYVYKAHAVTGDFHFEFDTVLVDSDTFSGETLVWGLSNTAEETYDDWDEGVYLGFYKSGSIIRLELYNAGGSKDYSRTLSLGEPYHVKVLRQGSTVTAEIYSATSQELVDTLIRTNANNYEYLYALSTDDGSSTRKLASGSVCAMREFSSEPLPPPQAPQLLSAQAALGQVTLTWSAIAEAQSYKVSWGTSAQNYTHSISGINQTTKVVPGLTNGTEYFFAVQAVNAAGSSEYSNELSAMPFLPIPTAPTGLLAVAQDGAVDLTWSASAYADQYKVYSSLQSGGAYSYVKTVSAISTRVDGLNNGSAYYFVVTAKNSSGESAYSNEVSAIPQGVPPQVYVRNVEYNAMGQTELIEYENGTVISYMYDPLSFRLNRKLTTNDLGESLQDFSYTYDAAGNIVAIVDNVNSASQTFEYDHLNRLVEADNPETYGHKTYRYDAIGNLKEKDGREFYYGEFGAGAHAVSRLSDGTTFAYNDNGNMTAKLKGDVTTEFIYDVENRLTEVKKNGATVSNFLYDGDGGRTKKVAASDGHNVTNIYVGSLFEKSEGKSINHIYLGSKHLAAVTGARMRYFFDDHLGGTNVVADSLGQSLEVVEYAPFGRPSRHDYWDQEHPSMMLFTGQRLDQETELYFYNARYYDPALGRFLTPDSIIPGEANPQAFNRYTYCHNNPVSFVDPDGHFPWLAAIIGAIIGGASGGISAHNNDQPVWQGILMGGVQGFFSGAALGTSFTSIADNGYWWGLARASGGFGLSSQVAGAAGWEQGQQALSYAAMGTAGLYMGANVLKGAKDWIHENRFGLFDENGAVSSAASDSHVHINGIITDLDRAKNEAFKRIGADFLAYNPTSGPIADLTEAALGVLTGTSSMSRQVANSLVGLSNISLTGYSHGGIIAGNTLVNLGLRNQRAVVSRVGFISTQINQPRAYLSAALAGIKGSNVTFTTHVFDFSNFVGLHTNPVNFIGGVGGTMTWLGGLNAHGRGPEIYGAYVSP